MKFLTILLLLFLFGCSKSSTPALDITGEWVGSYSDNGASISSISLDFTITKSGATYIALPAFTPLLAGPLTKATWCPFPS